MLNLAALTLSAIQLLAIGVAPALSQAASQDVEAKEVNYHYSVTSQNKPLGSATFAKTTKGDEIRKVLTLNLKIEDKVTSFIIDTTLHTDGAPIKKSFLQNGVPGGTITALFSSSSVKVIRAAGAQSQVIDAPAGAPIADLTETWFVKTKPAVGAKVTYYNFNVQSLVWEETTAIYIEDVEKKIGAKSYQTHHIRVSAGSGSLDEFVDDHNDPVLIDQGVLQITRAEG